MKTRDDSTYLGHILDAKGRIEAYVSGVKKEAFLRNTIFLSVDGAKKSSQTKCIEPLFVKKLLEGV
jgi:hypothetical protein